MAVEGASRTWGVGMLLVAGMLHGGCGGGAEGPVAPDLARGRSAVLLGNASGDPAVATDGSLAPEGTPPGDDAVTFSDVRSALVVDLGEPREVHALRLQAGAADVYFVEASLGGPEWRIVWRVAPIRRANELRTRDVVLDRPVAARWIRVRPTTRIAPSVSEIQVKGEGRVAWPALDTSPPGSPLPPWPSLNRERLAGVYEALAALAMVVAAWSLLAVRSPGTARSERARRGALLALAAASILAWPYAFNFHYPGFIHAGDMFHYYVGSKYHPELGYTRLYACTVVVDAEDGIPLEGRLVRDLDNNLPVTAQSQLERAGDCRARFSARRWESFRRDVAFFRARLGPEKWFKVRNDHGFNATPAWALVGGTLAGLVPPTELTLVLIALLDVVLLLAVLLMIGRGFGLEAACLAATFFGLDRLTEFGWNGGSFLRFAWLFWLILGIVLLRRGREAGAGFALACSTLLRVFPVFAFVGIACKAVVEAAEARSAAPLWRYRRLAAGGFVALVLVWPLSAARAGGPGTWVEFARNSQKHLETQAANFVGLQEFLAYRGDARFSLLSDPLLADHGAAWRDALDEGTRATAPARWAAGAGLLIVLALAARRAPAWAAAVLGLGLMPLLKLSGYYYCGWIAWAMLWPLAPPVGFALTVLGWVTNVIPQLFPEADQQHAWLSLAVVVFAVGVTAALAWRWSPRPAPMGTPPGKEPARSEA